MTEQLRRCWQSKQLHGEIIHPTMVPLFYSVHSSFDTLFPQIKKCRFSFFCLYTCSSSDLRWLSSGFGLADISYHSSVNPDELFATFHLQNLSAELAWLRRITRGATLVLSSLSLNNTGSKHKSGYVSKPILLYNSNKTYAKCTYHLFFLYKWNTIIHSPSF